VHVVMLQAEKAMRDTLAEQSLADLARAVAGKAPPEFGGEIKSWLGTRVEGRIRKPRAPKISNREVRP
jgi:hypothetical protein